MSRIRSIHPGFFTDEDVVSVSMTARLLLIGLWIEADDKGVFEWKPLRLKMRLFPADTVSVDDALSDLSAANIVRQFNCDGRDYGAIRNFQRFQKPRTPNDLYPITPEMAVFCGGTSEATPAGSASDTKSAPAKSTRNDTAFPQNAETPGPKPPPFPQNAEKVPLMEEGGGKREEGSSVASATDANASRAIDVTKAVFDSGVTILVRSGRDDRTARSIVGRWRKEHGDPAVLAALSRCEVEQPQEPVEWMAAALNAERRYHERNRNNRNTDEPQNPTVRAIVARQAERADRERRESGGRAADGESLAGFG